MERNPSADDLNAWQNFLAQGGSRADVFYAVAQSDEQRTGFAASGVQGVEGNDGTEAGPVRNLIGRLYDAGLNRAPDAEGLNYLTAQIANGSTPRDISDEIFNSAEFTARHAGMDDAAFIRGLYADALERVPSADELAFWTQSLAAGATRADLFFAFAQSAEDRQQVILGMDQQFGDSNQPVAADADSYTTHKNVALAVAAGSGVLANDSAPDGGLTALGVVTGNSVAASGTTAQGGTVALLADGSFRYTPASGFAGADSFTYRASDADGSVADATVTIRITDNPVTAGADHYGATQDTALTIAAGSGLLANDAAPDGGLAVLGVVSGQAVALSGATTQGGTVVLSADGSFRYTPATGFAGTDSFTYRAADADGSVADASVTIAVAAVAVDHPVTANADAYSSTPDTMLSVSAASGVLANDVAPDGGKTALGIVVGNTLVRTAATSYGGQVTLNADGSFSYTPASGFKGLDSFDYRVADTDGSTADSFARIRVSSPVVAVNDVYTTNRNVALTQAYAMGPLTNDTSPNDNKSTAAGTFTTIAGGSIQIGADGAFTYTPPSGFIGTDSYTYTVTNSNTQLSANGVMTFNVVNRAFNTAIPTVDLADIAAGNGGFRITGEGSFSNAGVSVAGVGDVNGDGRADVLIGAQGDGAQLQGAAYVVLGGASGQVDLRDVAAGLGGFKLVGQLPGDRAGTTVSAAGDVNGDGKADLLIGSPNNRANGSNVGTGEGAAYVVFGHGASAAVNLGDIAAGQGGFKIVGEAAGDQLGLSLASAGDVNGDGLADLLVSAPGNASNSNNSAAGASYLVFGKTDGAAVNLATLSQAGQGFKFIGGSSGQSGGAVSGIGDINGDGRADMVVNGATNGTAFVVYGKADSAAVDLDQVAAGHGGFTISGTDTANRASVVGVGDVNGDGVTDLAVGNTVFSNGQYQTGGVTVLFGKSDTASVDLNANIGNAGYRIVGDHYLGEFGLSVSGVGDLNGDGLADLLIGEPSYNQGRAYVAFGKADSATINLSDLAAGNGGFEIDGIRTLDETGISISPAGDVNGDGRPDLLIGSNATVNGLTSEGASYIVYGQASWHTV